MVFNFYFFYFTKCNNLQLSLSLLTKLYFLHKFNPHFDRCIPSDEDEEEEEEETDEEFE